MEEEKEFGEFDEEGNFVFRSKKAAKRKPLDIDYGSDSEVEDEFIKTLDDSKVVTMPTDNNLTTSPYEVLMDKYRDIYLVIQDILPILEPKETTSGAMRRLKNQKEDLNKLMTLVQIATDKFEFYDIYTDSKESLEKYRPKRKMED